MKTDAPATVPTPVVQKGAVADRVNPSRELAASIEGPELSKDLLGGDLNQIVQVRGPGARERPHATMHDLEQRSLVQRARLRRAR